MINMLSDGLRAGTACQTEAPTGGAGSGGVRRWTLVADKAGTILLQLELKRSWQPDPAQTFAVTVVVKDR